MAIEPEVRTWIDAFAGRLGIDPPDDAAVETLLDLAGVAAHASQRQAAPIACWLVGRAGLDVGAALAEAEAVAGSDHERRPAR
jgi:hypothetical protein